MARNSPIAIGANTIDPIRSNIDILHQSVQTAVSDIERIDQVISDDIQPDIQRISDQINDIEIYLDKVRPTIAIVNETYIPIMTRILLSRIMLAINFIFRIYTCSIYQPGSNIYGTVIKIDFVDNPSIYSVRRKKFKSDMQILRKQYGIDYRALVNNTINMNTDEWRY